MNMVPMAVKSGDEERVGRAFSNAAVSVLLGSVPGLFIVHPPSPATPFARYWPTTVDRSVIVEQVELDGRTFEIEETVPGEREPVTPDPIDIPSVPSGPTRRAPLGSILGARSGDKGGIGNIGVFARSALAYAWMAETLSVERLRVLMPDVAHLEIDRYELPNIWSLNFLVHGILGEGVNSSLLLDGQAKGLGEYLRACQMEVPELLLNAH